MSVGLEWKGSSLDDSPSYILTIIILLLAETTITLVYAALQNSRHTELQEAAEAGQSSAKMALALLKKPSRLYFTYILSRVLLHFGIALVATLWLVTPSLADQSTLSWPIAILLVMVIAAASVIVGTTVPEAVGSAYAIPMVTLLIFVLRLLVLFLQPITLLLTGISTILARLFGSEGLVNIVTEEEIMTLVNAGHTGGAIEDEEKAMIYSILQLDATLAREMMVPRIDMVALDADTTVQDAVEVFLESGYSRIPVYEENIDKILGLVYAKDVLNLLNNGGLAGHTVRDLVRSAYFVPETRSADKLLSDLQTHNIHMAIVVDEYGGTSGLVTIENIMEEIVGDIRDEYDTNEEHEYIQLNEHEYLMDAGMDIDDINTLLNISLSSDETDTLGGYIYLKIGRVPIAGEEVMTDEILLRVHSIEGRRIRKVSVKRIVQDEITPPPAPDTESESEQPLVDAP